MPSASALKIQIEAALRDRIPSALTPPARSIRPVAPTGVPTLDHLLDGGLPIGAITEIFGPESSGRTSLALSFVARMTQAARVCAWVDVSDTLDPETAAAIGVNLNRLLWVRCGVIATRPQASKKPFTLPDKYRIPPSSIKGLHGGGHGPHPRTEVKGLSTAVGNFLRPEPVTGQTLKSQPPQSQQPSAPSKTPNPNPLLSTVQRPVSTKPWSRIDQAMRVTDLLLQAGGFSSIVLDMGSIAPEFASRIPLATWFRYRAAAERSQTSFLLISQHACAKSSTGLLLRMHPGISTGNNQTVFTGLEHNVEIQRERFTPQLNAHQSKTHQSTPSQSTPSQSIQPQSIQPQSIQPQSIKVIPLRKPPQTERSANWQSLTTWASRV